MTIDPVVIAAYARTPMGGMQGALSSVPATKLGSIAIKAAVERAGVSPDAIDQVITDEQLPQSAREALAQHGVRVTMAPLASLASGVE